MTDWNPESEGGPETLFARLEKLLERLTTTMPMMVMQGDGQLLDNLNEIASSLRFRFEQRGEWATALRLVNELRREVGRIVALDATIAR